MDPNSLNSHPSTAAQAKTVSIRDVCLSSTCSNALSQFVAPGSLSYPHDTNENGVATPAATPDTQNGQVPSGIVPTLQNIVATGKLRTACETNTDFVLTHSK